MKGIVYVLTNPAMQNIVKIGHTTRSEIEQRMKELFTTGVPVPFVCAYACETEDCKHWEQALHDAFRPYRIHPNREFFSIEPSQAIAILRLVDKKDVTQFVNKEIDSTTTQVDKAAGEKLKIQRRPNFNFLELGIRPGAIITFSYEDQTVEAEVLNERQVKYKESIYYLTGLTKELLGLPYSVQPAPYWTFQGEFLDKIYNETYEGKDG